MTEPHLVRTTAGDWSPEPTLWNTDERNPAVQARIRKSREITQYLVGTDPQYRAAVHWLRDQLSR